MSVDKTRLPGNGAVAPVVGAEVTYVIHAYATKTQSGTSPPLGTTGVQDVVVVDTLPPGAAYVSSGGGGVFDATAGTVTWTIPNTTPAVGNEQGINTSLTLTYPSPAFVGGETVTNNVDVTARPWLRPAAAPITAHAQVAHGVRAGTGSPGLAVSKIGFYELTGGGLVRRGGSGQWFIRVNNTAGSAAGSVQVTDQFPCQFSQNPPGPTPCTQPVLPITSFRVSFSNTGTPTRPITVAWTANSGASGTTTLPTDGSSPSLGLAAGDFVVSVTVSGTLAVGEQWNVQLLGTVNSALPPVAPPGTVYAGGPLSPAAPSDAVRLENCITSALSGPAGSPPSAAITANPACGNNVVQAIRPTSSPQKLMNPSTLPPGGISDVTLNQTSASPDLGLTPQIADLLPVQLELAGPITVLGPASAPASDAIIATIPNYGGTGRTLVRVSWPTTDVMTNTQAVTVKFQVRVADGVAPGTYTNEVVTFDANDHPFLTCAAGSSFQRADIGDLDGDGSTADITCVQASNFMVVRQGLLAIVKSVKGSYDTSFKGPPAVGITAQGSTSTYRLQLTNTGNIPLTNAVFYDVLPRPGDVSSGVTLGPRNSAWRPLLAAVPTLPPGTTIEYSTALIPCRGDILSAGAPISSGPPGCTNDWTSTPPTPLSATTALRFFSTATLNPLETRTVDFAAVSVPTDAQGTAWNNIGAEAQHADDAGFLLPTESPPVGLTIPIDLQVTKVGTPAGGTCMPAGLITYTTTTTNTGEVPATNVEVTDLLPAGTTLVSATPSSGTYVPATGVWTVGTVASGQSQTLTIVARLPYAGATITNTAQVTKADQTDLDSTPNNMVGTTPHEDDEAATSCTVPTPSPILTLNKDVNPELVSNAGDTVTYSFDLTNDGNVTLTNVSVADTAFSGTGTPPLISCPAADVASMAPGATATCTATYIVTQADADAGHVDNTAVASGAPPSGPRISSVPDSAIVTIPFGPVLTLEKSVAPGVTLNNAGDTVIYHFDVTNDGNVTIKNMSVADTIFTGTGTRPIITCDAGAASMAPGDTVHCTAPYVITQADVDAGIVDNTAVATGSSPHGTNDVTSPPDSARVLQPGVPNLTLAKDVDPELVHTAGETATFTFVVTNDGNVTVTNVSVVEDQFTGSDGPLDISCDSGLASMAPGDSVKCRATYVVTQTDVNRGTVLNTAEAVGSSPVGLNDVRSIPDSAQITIPSTPILTLAKDVNPELVHSAGESVSYSFAVENDGNVTVTNMSISDFFFTGSTGTPIVSCDTGAASMAPGDSVTCRATYVVTQTDVDRGRIDNTAVAIGSSPHGTDDVMSQPDGALVTIPSSPQLTLMKSVDPEIATDAGDTVTYTFAITNSGNVTVSNVGVTELAFSGTGRPLPMITCEPAAASVLPGDTVNCRASYAVTQADVDAGTVDNTAVATGSSPTGTGDVMSEDSSAKVTIPAGPVLTLEKSVDPLVVHNAGDTVTYSFVVTNNGNVTLTDVSVEDRDFSGLGTPPDLSCDAGLASMAPGASVRCTATYVMIQDDIDAGRVDNTAIAIGSSPGKSDDVESPESKAFVLVTPTPQLTLQKSVSPDVVSAAGQTVTYTYVVTDTGNVTLHNIDLNEVAFSGTGTRPVVTCPSPVGGLRPQVSISCTATYVVTQADIDTGEIDNVAQAVADTPDDQDVVSLKDEATVTVQSGPALQLTKTASPTSVTKAGQSVTYSFVVSNIGNDTLTGITVADTAFSGSGTAPTISCPSAASSLAPGESVTCTAQYVVTQTDVDRGRVDNTAVASGTVPGGGTVSSPPSSASVAAPPAPALLLVKSVSPTTVVGAGATVQYRFVLTNQGNVTLVNVTVSESVFTGSGPTPVVTCPAEASSLAPGASVTCTAPYGITQADVDRGRVDNTATAGSSTAVGDVRVLAAESHAQLAVSPASPASVESLSFTGLDAEVATARGALICGVGVMLVLVARRRRRRLSPKQQRDARE
jgi:uncharacterized repeat protein (TIGR01451 family)